MSLTVAVYLRDHQKIRFVCFDFLLFTANFFTPILLSVFSLEAGWYGWNYVYVVSIVWAGTRVESNDGVRIMDYGNRNDTGIDFNLCDDYSGNPLLIVYYSECSC